MMIINSRVALPIFGHCQFSDICIIFVMRFLYFNSVTNAVVWNEKANMYCIYAHPYVQQCNLIFEDIAEILNREQFPFVKNVLHVAPCNMPISF